jgi:predicted amidohydrolase
VARNVTVGAAQLGPIQRTDCRADVVERLIALLRTGREAGCDIVVFPELALTTFFPRWYMEDQREIDAWFEVEMPGPDTQALFDEARRLQMGFVLGYAELTPDGRHFNTSILVDRRGTVRHQYRKVHLPGHAEHEPWRAFQHLEKRYFELPDEGFTVAEAFGGTMGMLICNDRRWPESYRELGLQGVEMVFIGYNTPVHNPPAPDHDEHSDFHNQLVMQAGAYQNGTWVVGVAKAGDEEGVPMIGGSCIIAPSGRVVVECATVGDELVAATCDLDACNSYKSSVFNLGVHRQPEYYGRIATERGPVFAPTIVKGPDEAPAQRAG